MCSIVISKAKRLLPLFLLPVLTMTVPSVSASAQPAELQPEYTEVQRDSAVVFRFVPGRLMFYYHYKDIIDLTADVFNDISRHCTGSDNNLSNCMMRYYDYFISAQDHDNECRQEWLLRSGAFAYGT